MVTFEPLASSSAGNAYRVSCPVAAPLLVDCGLSYHELSVALDFRVTELAGCLVSHAHGDHCKAVFDLMKSGVDCHASDETWKEIEKRTGKETWNKHRAKFIFDREPKKVGEWTVTAFRAVHDCPGTLGFVIDSPEGDRGVYLTDTMYSLYTFEGLTHLWVECNHSDEIRRGNVREGRISRMRSHRTARSHMSLERLQNMLRANDLSKVEEIWLLHLSDENSDELAFKEAIVKEFGKPVYVAAKRAA